MSAAKAHKPPLARKPLTPTHAPDLAKIEEFAAQAPVSVSTPAAPAASAPAIEKAASVAATTEAAPAEAPAKASKKYPWEAASVRPDVKKAVNLLLPEPLFLKLQFLSKETRISQQEIIREALIPALDKALRKLG